MRLRRVRGKNASHIVVVCFVALLACLCPVSRGMVSETSFLDLPALERYAEAGQFSSRDRTGGNRDWSDEAAGRRGFLYRDENGDRVLAEVFGSGELNRFWFTGIDNAGTIRIYLDDEARPAYELPVRELFAGNTPPFTAPYVFDDDASSGGFVSYVRLPFERYLKVATTGEPSYYHVGYRRHAEATNEVARTLEQGAAAPFVREGRLELEPGSASLLETIQGPAVITRLTLHVPEGLVKPAVSGTVVTDHGRAFTGYSEFTVRIDPNNAGVRLVRRLDYSIGDQTADVYVDGTFVGRWSSPGSAEAFNWRDTYFDIPGEHTAGKESLRIRVEFVSSQLDWNEFYYWIYARPVADADGTTDADHPHGPGLVLTDALDVGDAASERAHDYSIVGEKWSGYRDWMYPPPPDPGAEALARTLDALRSTWLSITWDGHEEPAILAPLSLFFATPLGPHPIDTVAIRVAQTDGGVEFTSRFPMPFASEAEMRLHYLGPERLEIAYEIEAVAHPDLPALFAQGEIGYLHATYRRENPTQPGRDYTLLSTAGTGKVVGVAMRLGGPGSRGYLEGDERIRVDGRTTPSIYGTGTEDHFGGGWYFNRGPFALPLYGAPGHDLRDGLDQTSVYRFFITDPIPFRTGIDYTIEHGGVNEIATDYESVVFWYGLPRLAARAVDRVDLSAEPGDAQHVVIEGPTRRVRLVSSFEGPMESTRSAQTVIYHEGPVRMAVQVDPDNLGVILRRIFDQRVGPQRATVWVDGEVAGTWYHPETNTRHRFADSDFFIPSTLTRGKERLLIEIVPEGEWNAVGYEVYSQVVPFEPEQPSVALDGLRAEAVGDAVSLHWVLRTAEGGSTPGDDLYDVRYRIYRSEKGDPDPMPWLLAGESESPAWQETRGLEHGVYYYRVEAIDGFGRRLALSETVAVEMAPMVRVEGEDLINLRAVGGSVQRQGMDWAGPQWSGGHHLFFQAGGEGASVAGDFYVAESGRYEVLAYYTLAPDYGTVQFLLDGVPLGDAVDGYAPGVQRAGPLTLGTVDLAAGEHTFAVQVVGRNAASRGYFAGLDLLELKRVEGGLTPSPPVESLDFFTSFETGDALPERDGAVATGSDGRPLAAGIAPFSRPSALAGDVTEQIVRIRASGNNPPHETDRNLLDFDPGTKWLAFQRQTWIEVELAEPAAVVQYAFTSANDAPGRDPRNWTFLGSHDGMAWDVLDRRTNEFFSSRFQQRLFDVDNDTPYKFYRWEISSTAGDDLTQLADIAIATGQASDLPKAAGMEIRVSTGPGSTYTAKPGVGWTGLRSLEYSGTHVGEGRAYSYNVLFDVDIPVGSNTELSYMIFPMFSDPNHHDYSATYVAIDLAFDDGTYLHELGAVDQHGVELSPSAQGESKTLYPHQWNFKRVNVGAVAEGKTIKRILLAYDNPRGPGVFKGYIDDLKIEHSPEPRVYEGPLDYVNTLRGTNSNGVFSRGNTFPAVAVPHGFNFWTPATDAGSHWIYAYHEHNNEQNLPEIQAFSLSHMPSPWMGDRQTFQVMPSDAPGRPPLNREERALAFDHTNEIAKPHYYAVTFENGIKAEITPTDHAAMMRFTFPGEHANLIFDNITNAGGITLYPESRSLAAYTDYRSGLSTGATRMFIYATFDRPVIESGRLSGEGRPNVGAYFKFDVSESPVVTMRIATSLISVEQAKRNLEMEIAPDDTFEAVMERAKQAWEDKLSIIEVEGATEDQLVTLYSNLYRLFLYPNSAFENVGTVEEPVYAYASQFALEPCTTATETETCAPVREGKVYVNNGFWDTYRTAWPAYALLTPSMAAEMIEGFVQHYRDGGWIARWSSPGYANLMVGTSANVAFADAYLKGVTGFDVRTFYQSALKDAAVVPPNEHVGRKGLATSIFDGYTNTSTPEGLSWALEGYINDFGIANLARALAEEEDPDDPYQPHYRDDYRYYLSRAQNYVHMFNSEIGFFNGRLPSGAFRSRPGEFDPAAWWGDYTETNAWNMAFHAPHDGQGLANLYGGRAGLAAKLDEFFATPELTTGKIHEEREAKDVRMGMYAHSNQPSHHIIYMYLYAGQPWKTQEKVREVLERLYIGSEIGQGYPGDEDNGEMSAWWIFSALGLYPLRVGSPEYVIGSPLFTKATVHLENGKKLVISAPNNSRENKYVQSVTVNGQPWNKAYIMHSEIANGAVIEFEMGPEPSTWATGVDALPPSITPAELDGVRVNPLRDLTDGLIRAGRGVASDSEGGPARALFDNTSNLRWTVRSTTPWIQFEFSDGPVRAEMYTLTSGTSLVPDDLDSRAADPVSWVLLGSNDGEEWTVLDEREGQVFPWRRYTRAFSIQNPGSYSIYRLQITENGGHDSTTLSEVELLGYVEQ